MLMLKNRNRKLLALDGAVMLVLLFADQFTKYLAVFHLKGKPDIPILKDILVLQYLENKGAAFGMLQNQKIFFLLIEILILLVIGFALVKMPADKKYNLMHLTAVLVAGGAIGNMIDRVRYDYVVDFIYFVRINFPIFNVADIYATVSAIVLLFLLLFVYKEKDLYFISFKQKRYRELK